MAEGKGLIGTPWENPPCPTPSGGDGTISGTAGGFGLPQDQSAGLVGTPFEKPLAAPGSISEQETANSSGLRVQPQTVDGLTDAPAPGAHVEKSAGVTSPGPLVYNLDEK